MQPRLGPLDLGRLRPLAPKSQSERARRVGSSRGRAGRGAGRPRVLRGGAWAGEWAGSGRGAWRLQARLLAVWDCRGGGRGRARPFPPPVAPGGVSPETPERTEVGGLSASVTTKVLFFKSSSSLPPEPTLQIEISVCCRFGTSSRNHKRDQGFPDSGLCSWVS